MSLVHSKIDLIISKPKYTTFTIKTNSFSKGNNPVTNILDSKTYN
jgi:hypothetical protein